MQSNVISVRTLRTQPASHTNMMKSLALLLTLVVAVSAAEDFVCPEPYGFYANPDNCIKYYQCSDDVAQEIVCGLREFTTVA